MSVPEEIENVRCNLVATERLTPPIITGECYESPDGAAIDFNKDFFSNTRAENIIPGPFATSASGENKFVIRKD